ncbi:MAG: succinate dehydrogenase, cytochrome b556 subunit [Candidatus Methylumidiphilus sp.]
MNERPLSPHLQVYRLPLTGLVSITHRATGVFLSVGMIVLVLFLMAVAKGPDSYATAQALLQSFIGRLFLWGWIFSLLFHMVHGVRHLIWDTGHTFERETLDRYARYEIIATLALAALLFFVALIN